ncbi:MAG: FkbM family methyltransferase [Anderseniella sp.]|jgi:FkbM family methyltransferase|nr:FkbM family methyltransferase [Anderseniella sp.]
MSDISVGNILKAALPTPMRRALRAFLHYVQRVGRWPIILWQVRGTTRQDQWVLLRSALAAPFLSIEEPLEWQDPILLANAQVDVRGVGRFMIRAHSDELWHVLPWRERATFRLLHDKLRLGDTFIDAGANIGVYSVLAARLVGPHGKVFSVEMMPDTVEHLEHNLALNGISNATVCRAALSNRIDQFITAEVQPGKYGQATISPVKADPTAIRSEVKTTTLDEVSTGLRHVRFVKMDLEGAEALALQGAKVLLRKTDYLIYENWGRSWKESNSLDLCLREVGFTLRRIDGNNWLAVRSGSRRQDQEG